MKRLKAVLSAYLIVSIFSLTAGFVVARLARVALYSDSLLTDLWFNSSWIWLAFAGLPGLRYANQHLARALGIRSTPTLKVASSRSIPIMGDVIKPIFKRAQISEIVVADDIIIECDEFVFTETDLLPVLRRGWMRQRAGRHAMSRSYWLGRKPFLGDRDKYNAFMESMEACGALVGRGDRKSGKLIVPPLSTLYNLREMATG